MSYATLRESDDVACQAFLKLMYEKWDAQRAGEEAKTTTSVESPSQKPFKMTKAAQGATQGAEQDDEQDAEQDAEQDDEQDAEQDDEQDDEQDAEQDAEQDDVSGDIDERGYTSGYSE